MEAQYYKLEVSWPPPSSFLHTDIEHPLYPHDTGSSSNTKVIGSDIPIISNTREGGGGWSILLSVLADAMLHRWCALDRKAFLFEGFAKTKELLDRIAVLYLVSNEV